MSLDSINIEQLQKICHLYGVDKLYVFGSFASGTLSDASDIDLLVEFLDGSPDGAFDRFTGLQLALEEFFNRKVDLLVNKPFRNPIFQKEIDQSKVLVYAA
ncbi:MAG TPA: nucleotidyltransferase [Bacteroidetes bacterium]|nr:nucleotidyltransferase [Bacteroidota bacterium]